MKRRLNLKLVLSVLGGLLILGIGVHFLHGYQLGQNAHRLLDRADKARDAKEFGKAEFYYEQYLSFVPNDADTVQKLAQMLEPRAETAGERVRVVLLMEQVLRLKPSELELRLRLVQHLIALDRVPEAIDNLRKLEKTWHDRAEILHMLGWCLEAKKDYAPAVKALEEAIRANPKQLKSYTVLVEIYQDRLAQPEDALRVIDKMVTENPNAYQAFLARSRFHQRRREEKLADEDRVQAYKLAPERAEVIFAVAEAARAKGNWAEAERLLKDAVARFPDQAAFYRMMVDVQLQTKNDAQAMRILQDGVKRLPQSSDLAILLIDLMIDQGKTSEATKKIEELRQTSIRPTLPNYLTARLRVVEKRWNEAITLLESVRKDLGAGSEWNSRVDVLLGIAYRHIGDHEQELAAFQRAVLEDATWTTASLGLAQAHLNTARFDEASKTLESLRAARDLPTGFWTLLSRTRIYAQLALPEAERDWSGVEEALTEAAKIDPAPGVALAHAELHLVRRQYDQARTTLDTARSVHPDNVSLWCALADVAVRQDRLDEADKILDQAAKQGLGDQLDLRLAQVRLWGRRGNAADVRKLTQLGNGKATNLPNEEERVRLAYELADTWHRLRAWAQAEAILRDLANDAPNNTRSRFALFELALQRNQVAAARQWQEQLHKIEGERGSLWRYASAALLVHEAQGKRSALAEARKKLVELEAIRKGWSRIPLLAGTISEREGNAQQAIVEYTRALDLGETQPRVVMRLVELLIERREYAKANTELLRYEQRFPLPHELARFGVEASLGLRDPLQMRNAVMRAEQVVTLPARDYRDALWLAHVYQAADENTKAEAVLRDTLADAGHVPDVWIAWLEHLTRTNQPEAAERELERLKKELPANRQALTLARGYEAMGRPDQADAAYQKALADHPLDLAVLGFGADFYRRADRREQARKWYERMLSPDLGAPAEMIVQTRRYLAVMLSSTARSEALALLDSNKQVLGDTIADQRILWYIESQNKAARETAISKYQESFRVQLPTPEERVLLAQMLDAAGLAGQARTQLAEAVNEAPQTAAYLVRYIRMLMRAEEWDEAQRHVQRLETMEPGSERVRDLKAKLPAQ